MYSDKEVYGQIEYFFVYLYSGNQRMLAFIQWRSEVYIDKYEAKRFQGFINYDFIEVKYIGRSRLKVFAGIKEYQPKNLHELANLDMLDL